MKTQYQRMEEMFEQLESCGFECEGGKLEGNIAFIELKSLLLGDREEIKEEK